MGTRKTLETLSRRQALQVCLAPAGLAAASWLTGCSDSKASGDEAPASEPDAQAARDSGRDVSADARARVEDSEVGDADTATPAQDTAADASTKDATASDATSDAAALADANTAELPWASGGTKSMQGNYPDPFAGGATGVACALYPAQTLGPCYASPVMSREDISDGVTGLPVRMSFLVVESDGCTPVPNAEVDVWSAGSNGVYSQFASGVCNPARADVASLRYCRGKQNTNAQGRVDFSTVFPGWYSGRTIHIHFTVRVGGQAYITSQLYFEDALSEEILQQVDYKARGTRDTTNRTDSVLRNGDLAEVVFETAKRADGVLHAWKVLSVRS
jgi:protocatechuate 3,4-dioxygenase beta subunit